MSDTLNDVIDALNEDVETLNDVRGEHDFEEAISACDNVAYQLRRRADELEAISSKLSDAQEVLA
jgi:hypothetical protein